MICHEHKFIYFDLGYGPEGLLEYLEDTCSHYEMGNEDFVKNILNSGNYEDYFTFTFICDPFTRCWNVWQKGYTEFTFETFIKKLYEKSLNEHSLKALSPFAAKLKDYSSLRPFNFIGRQSLATMDCRRIFKSISISPFKVSTSGASIDLSQFSNESIRLIKEIYHEDFITFYPNYIHYSDEFNTETRSSSDVFEDIYKEFDKLAVLWKDFLPLESFNYFSQSLTESKDLPPFEEYNKGKKIAIVSLHTPETACYALPFEEIVKKYCLINDYTFYIYRENINKQSFPNWSKAKALINHIEHHDWIVWLDSDAIPLKFDKKLEDFITKYRLKQAILSKDFGTSDIDRAFPLNTGVMFWKNTCYIKNILQKLDDFCHENKTTKLFDFGSDQGVLSHILKKSDPSVFNYKLCEMSEFNTDPRNISKETFILHFMNFPLGLKHLYIKYLHNKLINV
tara:strand:+ start:14304 stop:15659 length:1356 start_codon:yes stop_codon:yes gene_type:complete